MALPCSYLRHVKHHETTNAHQVLILGNTPGDDPKNYDVEAGAGGVEYASENLSLFQLPHHPRTLGGAFPLCAYSPVNGTKILRAGRALQPRSVVRSETISPISLSLRFRAHSGFEQPIDRLFSF